MPYSKRDQKVALTKTKKKNMEIKEKLVLEIRKALSEFKYMVIFSIGNLRNAKLKEVRQILSDCRFFFGKRRVIELALGRTSADESLPGLHLVHRHNLLRGQHGLLFSNRPLPELVRWFRNYRATDFARSGDVATRSVSLEPGPLPTDKFSHSLEPRLRTLGLPTQLIKGVVHLSKSHTVCEEGDILKPEQAQLLQLLGEQLAIFKLSVAAVWERDSGKLRRVGSKARTTGTSSAAAERASNSALADADASETEPVSRQSKIASGKRTGAKSGRAVNATQSTRETNVSAPLKKKRHVLASAVASKKRL